MYSSRLFSLLALSGISLAMPKVGAQVGANGDVSPLKPRADGFVGTDGAKFDIADYLVGTNCYWCSFLTNSADVGLVFDHLQDSAVKVLRVWGFNDVNEKPGSGQPWFQYLAPNGSEINDGPTGLQLLDAVVAAAEDRDIKLIIPFVNYWDDYGGISAYAAAFGGDKISWFSNEAAQEQYRTYVKAVVSRYTESPAIFSWELSNEIRCQGCDTSIVYDWAKSTSEYVKSLDGNHLVTLGDEGFGLSAEGSYPETYYEGVDWVKNLGIETLDFGTLHLYPEHWDTTADWGNTWIEAHAKVCAEVGKPCMLEEFGWSADKCGVGSQWQKTAFSAAGIAGDMFWQLGDNLSSGPSNRDIFTVDYGTADWDCVVTNHPGAS